VVAASCATSRACRSCSKEAADYGVTADDPHTVAAPCFRSGLVALLGTLS
jgi:hypothetical protein